MSDQSSRISRKKVHESELEARLGLDVPWVDVVEKRGKWIDESVAPTDLPESIRAMFDAGEIKEVESCLDSLAALGCQRPVLYFCLEELSDDAGAFREGRKRVSVADEDGEYETLDKWDEGHPYGSRKELEHLIANADLTKHLVHRYRSELLLAAQTGEHRPPGGETELDDVEALSQLEKNLGWVSRLAQEYTPPFLDKILKSKGYLFLTAYVTRYANTKKDPGQRMPARDKTLESLMGKFNDTGQKASDLREKLRKFERDYPRLYKLLIKDLDNLHRFHQEHQHSPSTPQSNKAQ